MGWKSIELQVALPRVQDAGKLQEQMMKQNQHLQESLAENQIKQDIEKRHRVNKSSEVNQAKVKKDPNGSNQQAEDEQREREKHHNEKHPHHPYLGTKFDFTR